MIIAAAQTNPGNQTIAENLEDHLRIIRRAANEGASLITFPEMSITGYQREKGQALAISEHDERLQPLRDAAVKHQMTIVAGAPVPTLEGLCISAFIFHLDGSQSLYTKRHLHGSEADFYVPCFAHNPTLALAEHRGAIAICADIANPQHAADAGAGKHSLYLPCIFYTVGAMAEAHEILSGYASNHQMMVLMSNYTGHTWNLNAGGRSAAWTDEGKLIAELSAEEEGLLVVSRANGVWSGVALSL